MDRNCFGVKRLLQKVDHFRCADGMEIWHQIRDTFGNVAWSGSGRDVPVISADVLDSSAALTILHSHGRHQRARAGLHRLLINAINVLDIEMKDRRHRRALPLRAFSAAANHQHRIADSKFRMKSSLRAETVNFTLGPKDFLDKVDLLMDIRNHDVWRDYTKALTNLRRL